MIIINKYFVIIIHDLTLFFKGISKYMKKIIFEGVGTALITPMKNGRIDYRALDRLIEIQIDAGVGALIIGGTTGEAATLSDRERYTLYGHVKRRTCGRIPVIFGVGTNDTRIALKHIRQAAKIGCDGLLAVTPYYNKGTETGVTEHYEKLLSESNLPVILYNVPSRTGVNLTEKQLIRLSENENAVAIKEAADSLDRFAFLSAMRDKLGLYSGSDSGIYATLALGGLGVISVISNIFPRETVKIYKDFKAGAYDAALNTQNALLPFIAAMFLETNPAPVKYAMSLAGLCKEEIRLPISPPKKSTRDLIKAEYERVLSLGI